MRNLLLLMPASLCLWMACQSSPTTTSIANTMSKEKNGLPTPEWAHDAVLYECNVRQFSEKGDLESVRAALPRLKDLGINVLWLMPIHPIGLEKRKGGLGSPYSVKNYFEINPDYGNLSDLKKLVAEAHTLGLKVILDWVPNHTAWDAAWIKEHPEYYTKINGQLTSPINERGEPTGWDDVVDLDFNQKPMRQAMINAMKYWIRECDIDGYRVDMAGLVPNDFWAEVKPALDSVKTVFMLSEWQDEPGHFTTCFQANYGWKWKDITKDIAAGKQTAQSLDTLLQFLNKTYPPNYWQLYFTQNHDENTWNGAESDLYGAAADVFNVLMFTWQGMPMLYNGQEDGMKQRLAFFEKDPVKWGNYGKTEFFQTLCAVKRSNKALKSGNLGGALVKISTNDDAHIYAFTREKDGQRVIVVTNLSKDTRNVTLQIDESMQGAYFDVFGAATVQMTPNLNLNMKPWDYLVLTNK